MADQNTRFVLTAVDQTQAALGSATKGVQTLAAAINSVPGFGGIAASLGALAGFGAFKVLIADTMHWAAGMQDLSEKTGASVENLSGLSRIAKVAGIDMAVAETGMIRLAKALAGGDDEAKAAGNAFAFLGLKAADLRKMDTAEAMKEVADAMNQYADGSGKTALAMAIFGKQGAQLLPLLKELAEQSLTQGKLTREQAEAAKELEKAWNKVNMEGGAWSKKLAIDLMPTMASLMDYVVDAKDVLMGMATGLVVVGKTVGTFGSIVAAVVAGKGPGDIKAAIDDWRRFVEAAREDVAKRERDSANRPKFRAMIDAALAGGGPQKPKADFTDPGKAGGGSDPFATLLKDIDQRTALLTSEADSTDKLTEAQKFALKVMTDLQGGYLKLTDAEKLLLTRRLESMLAADGSVAALKKEHELVQERQKVTGKMVEQDAKVAEMMRATSEANKEHIDGLQFELELIGKSEPAKQRARDLRAIDVKLTKDLIAAEKELANRVNEEGFNADLEARRAELIAQAAEAKQAHNDAADAILAKTREWSTGVSDALNKYMDDVRNAAASAERFTTSMLSSMEDAWIKYATTGKFSIRDLANTFIAETARMLYRKSFAPAAAAAVGGLGDWLSGALGFGGGTSGPSQAAGGGSWLNLGTSLPSVGGSPSYAGGGWTGNGPRTGGVDGMGGFWAILHPQETVTDHAAGQTTAGQGVTVVQHLNFAVGIAQTVRAEVMNLMPQIQAAANAGALDARLRGATRAAYRG